VFAENDCFSHRGTASHTTQIRENGKTPLFRSALGETGVLTDKPMNRVDAYRMVRRRTADAGFRVKLGCHVSSSA